MPEPIHRTYYLAGCGLLVTFLSLCVLVGWQFDIAMLKSLMPGLTPMNPVTALTFLGSGCWLLVLDRDRARRSLLLVGIAILVLIIGLIHSVTYFFPCDAIRLDYLLYGNKIRAGRLFNLIAPNTAIVFSIAGIVMLSTWATNKWAQLVRQFLVLLGFFMVYVSLLGYIYHIQPAYRLGGFTPMALLTSIVFLVLYVGLFVSNTRFGISKSYASNLAGGHLLRKIIPLLLLLPPITGYLSLLGEQKGIYPTEFGIGIYTLVFTLVVFVFVTMHASMENKKQLYSMQTQQLLEESEQKFRSVFNSLREGVMSTTPEGLLLFSNPSMSRITGYSEAQLKGKNAMELLQPDSLRNLQHQGPEYGTLTPGDYQTQIVTMSGERLWVAVKALPVLNEHGVTSHIISTFTDITAEKIKLQDLSAFTASAAHDLNSPVARISMLANMFDATDLSEEQKWYLNSIKEVSHSMGQLLKDLLNFSRLGAGSLEKSLLDVNKLAEAVVTMQMPANFAGEINVQHLPPMIANESAMRQLFTNLVSNAIKYSSKSPHPIIWIEAYEQNGQAVYCVRDNGVGLREEQIKQLFTPFRRFHAQFEGNGMGLAIVKRIVEKHNGTIWAEPNEPQGLSIKFTVGSEVPLGI